MQFPLLNDEVDHGEGHPQAQGEDHVAIFREAVLMHPQKPGVVHETQEGQGRRRHGFSEIVGAGAVPVVVYHKEHEDGQGHGPKDEVHDAGGGQFVQKQNLRHVQVKEQDVKAQNRRENIVKQIVDHVDARAVGGPSPFHGA